MKFITLLTVLTFASLSAHANRGGRPPVDPTKPESTKPTEQRIGLRTTTGSVRPSVSANQYTMRVIEQLGNNLNLEARVILAQRIAKLQASGFEVTSVIETLSSTDNPLMTSLKAELAQILSNTEISEADILNSIKEEDTDKISPLLLELLKTTITSGRTPLMIALESNKIELVFILLASGMNPNTSEEDRKYIDRLVKQFLSSSSDDSQPAIESFLINAVMRSQVDLIKSIVEITGFDIGTHVDNNGNTLLFYANDAGTAQLLLNLGVNPNHRNNFGETALIRASRNGEIKAVTLLLQLQGINVDEKDMYERTALIGAAIGGHYYIVKILLENGANPNEQDSTGGAAHMFAAVRGFNDIVKILLENGADIRLQSSSKRTALDYARQNSDQELINLLINYGAK